MAKYQQLCPIIYGEDTIYSLGKRASRLGINKAMIVSGKNMAKSETYAICKDNLQNEDIQVVEFNEVLPDAPDYIVNKGGEIAREEEVDGILAIGGGSSMDAAKGINILINNPPPINNYFGKPKLNPGVPLIMVVTTAGTGSESSGFAIVKDTENNVKNPLFGSASLGILDPKTTVSVPPRTTKYTGTDAFAHAVEAITTKVPNPKSELLAKDAIKRITRSLPKALENAEDLEARGDLLLASNFAGMAFNDAMAHLGHAIAHVVGAKFNLPHGLACALSAPEVMKYAAHHDASKVKIVGEAMGEAMELPTNESKSNEAIGEQVAEAIRSFNKDIGVESFRSLKISRENLFDTVDLVFKDSCYNFVPREISQEEMKNILASMYDNY